MLTKETDVLIIGGGGAGLRAALAAKEKNVDVTLVFKKGGNATIFAAGGQSAVVDNPENPDSYDSHIRDTMESGRWLNDLELVKLMAENGPQELKELVGWGVEYIQDKDGKLKGFQIGGHSFPRTIRSKDGNYYQLYRVLMERAKEKGVKINKGFEVLKLISSQGRVRGALGIDAEGNKTVIKARAVVLASGGLGQMYQNTTNPPGLTGDGYILGLQAGAALIDMEFLQYYPTSLVYPPKMKGKIVTESLRGEGAVLLNNKMERFMVRYAPDKMERATRDVISRAIYQEIMEGRGTENQGVYIDARSMERGKMLECFTNADRLIALGLDPGEKLIEVAPSAHFCCGGILIDSECFTGVEGLWAAGEVTGGVHGANRLGSNAITEILVFGRIAGESAAKWAQCCLKKSEDTQIGEGYQERLKGLCAKKDAGDHLLPKLMELEAGIKAGIWQGAGIIRSEDTLKKGLGAMEEIHRELEFIGEKENLGSSYPYWSRLMKMALLGRVIIGSALRREESRGVHYRSDYPVMAEKFSHSIRVTIDEEKALHYTKHTVGEHTC